MKIIKKSICIILALASIFALNACGEDNNEKEITTYPPAKEMTFEQIRADFLANQVSAEQKHIGQRYTLTAEIENIQKEYISIYDGRLNTRLHYKGQTDFIMSLSAGDKITFDGTLTEVNISPSHYGGMKFEDVVFIGKVD